MKNSEKCIDSLLICWNPHGPTENWGRYTFLGFDPKLEITCTDGEMTDRQVSGFRTENPSEYLRQILADYKSPRFDYLPPFTGGLVRLFLLRLPGIQRAGCPAAARKIRRISKMWI